MRNLLAFLLLVGFAEQSHPQSLIQNGGFELPDITGPYWTFDTNSPSGVSNWTIEQGSVNLNNPGTFGSPFEGNQWLDLNGNEAGIISQTFATEIGTVYNLVFRYANNTALLESAQARVALRGTNDLAHLVQQFSHSGSTSNDMGWLEYSTNFVANSTTTLLRFTALIAGPSGMALDAVSVTAIPEACGVASLIPAFVGTLLLLAWRRRS